MPLISPEKLNNLVYKIFKEKGLTHDDAKKMADTLVEANLRGVASHGVLRIGNYINRINLDGTDPKASITVISETPTSAVIDGGNGLGILVAHKAVEIARKKAENAGFACVAAKKSNHYGAAAFWAEMLAGDDMIGFSCSNVEPIMAPPGAKSMAIGNNPFSIVVPAGKHKSICADMATSMVALGKILDYRLKNQPLPDGWAIDENGTPTNDANAAKHLLPFAAHKGYGIAVILEVLCSILSGGDFGKSINSMYGNIDKPNNLSHCFMAMKIEPFRDLEQFKDDVDTFIDYLHAIPAAKGAQVLMPGEIEHNKKNQSLKEGIDLPQTLITELVKISESLGICDALQYFR